MRLSKMIKVLEDRFLPPDTEQAKENEKLRHNDRHKAVFDESTDAIFDVVRDFTMTSRERIAHLCHAIDYVVNSRLPGSIVECGVWRGGSIMAAILRLQSLGIYDREFFLYDTFEGMPPPEDIDIDYEGNKAADLLRDLDKKCSDVWAYCSYDDVVSNIQGVNYDMDRICFVKGKVEETLEINCPDQISLLRLDTDWYRSTYHELEILYPRLVKGGVLIIDDYGHWNGARKAVDEYISNNSIKLHLVPIDYTGRIAVKVD